jgi:hypothetical protein
LALAEEPIGTIIGALSGRFVVFVAEVCSDATLGNSDKDKGTLLTKLTCLFLKFARYLLRVVKNNAEGISVARPNRADAVAHVGAVIAARAADQTVIDGEEDGVALVRREHFDAGLSAQLLLGPSSRRWEWNPFLQFFLGEVHYDPATIR